MSRVNNGIILCKFAIRKNPKWPFTINTLTRHSLSCSACGFVYGARAVRMLLHFNIYYNPPRGTCQLDRPGSAQSRHIHTLPLFMTLRANKLLRAGFICLPSVLRAETIFWAENLTLFRMPDLLNTLFTLNGIFPRGPDWYCVHGNSLIFQSLLLV